MRCSKDSETEAILAPGGATATLFDATGTLNMREIPIAIQLPDWNDWLPDMHPLDVWGDFWEATRPIEGDDEKGDVLGRWDELSAALEDEGPAALAASGKLEKMMTSFTASGVKFFMDHRHGDGVNNLGPHTEEVGKRSARHWTSVRLWELAMRYELDDDAPAV